MDDDGGINLMDLVQEEDMKKVVSRQIDCPV